MLGVFSTLLFPVLFWDRPVLSLWHLLLLPLCLVCVTPPLYFVSLISICVNLNSFNCPLLFVAVYCLPTVWFLLCVFCWIYGLFFISYLLDLLDLWLAKIKVCFSPLSRHWCPPLHTNSFPVNA